MTDIIEQTEEKEKTLFQWVKSNLTLDEIESFNEESPYCDTISKKIYPNAKELYFLFHDEIHKQSFVHMTDYKTNCISSILTMQSDSFSSLETADSFFRNIVENAIYEICKEIISGIDIDYKIDRLYQFDGWEKF